MLYEDKRIVFETELNDRDHLEPIFKENQWWTDVKSGSLSAAVGMALSEERTPPGPPKAHLVDEDEQPVVAPDAQIVPSSGSDVTDDSQTANCAEEETVMSDSATGEESLRGSK